MKYTNSIIALAILLFPTGAFAEAPTQKGGCWSRDVAMRPMYDPQKNVSVMGRAISIESGVLQRSSATDIGSRLRLKLANNQEIAVYLAPSWYLDRERIQIKAGDRVEIRGAKLNQGRQPMVVVAATIKKGDQTWAIRDPKGKPMWVKWCKPVG
jgi:hypothetical protein